MLAGFASADIIIGYTAAIGPFSTDITNAVAGGSSGNTASNLLPSWMPGNAASTATSNVSGSGMTTGISMASLNSPGTNYNLIGYDILIKETLTGNYTITNNSTSSAATGSAYIDTYSAVSMGAGNTLAPPLTNTTDPSNDLFRSSVTGLGTCGSCAQGEQPLSIGGGPDPNAPPLTSFTLAKAPGPGNSLNSGPINVNSGWVDYGCEVLNLQASSPAFCSDSNAAAGQFSLLTTALGLVTGPPRNLTFNFSTATQTDTSVTGGNLSTQYNTSVREDIAVLYDYTTSSGTPEPTTMALMGGALLGLGLIGRRLKKSKS